MGRGMGRGIGRGAGRDVGRLVGRLTFDGREGAIAGLGAAPADAGLVEAPPTSAGSVEGRFAGRSGLWSGGTMTTGGYGS
jgi:hypothetical protein